MPCIGCIQVHTCGDALPITKCMQVLRNVIASWHLHVQPCALQNNSNILVLWDVCREHYARHGYVDLSVNYLHFNKIILYAYFRNIMEQLASQGYRCTGCGMKQDPSQARHFRFCNYTGKYFCQRCHTNATSVIPAYIMDRWSFKK